jgi:hypothetical protein
MRLMARNGVILAGGLFALWVVLAHPVGGGEKFPSDTQTEIVRTKASWEEKNENRKLAKRYAWAAFGWRGGEWECLESLWTRESRFDHFAQNPTSSVLSVLLNSLEREVEILHSKYCEAYVILIDVMERLARLTSSLLPTDTTKE